MPRNMVMEGVQELAALAIRTCGGQFDVEVLAAGTDLSRQPLRRTDVALYH